MYWPWEARSTLWLVAAGLIVWFIVVQPARAGADVSHAAHFIAFVFSRLGKFAESV